MIASFLTLGAANPVDHVTDKPLWSWGHDYPFYLSSDGSLWIISNVTVMLVFSAIVTALIVVPAAKRIRTGEARSLEDFRAQGVWANFVEAICLYLRSEVFKPVLGAQTDRYTPMLWTFFWFILVCNLLGLIPFLDITAGLAVLFGVDLEAAHFHGVGGTATQSIWVTGALATIAFIFYNGVALLKDPIGYLKHLTGGAPWFMWPIMIVVEIVGTFVKPFALALRLFANMTGGHIIIAVLLSFVYALIRGMGAVGYGMAIIPLLGSVAINLLEVLVGFIQAYIFTFLTCLFLGQLVVHEHDEHEEHETHEHGVSVDPHTALERRDVPLQPSHAGGRH